MTETNPETRLEGLLEAYRDISVGKDTVYPLSITYKDGKDRNTIRTGIRYKGSNPETETPYLHLEISSDYRDKEGNPDKNRTGSIDIGKDNPGEVVSSLPPETDLKSIFSAAKHGLEISLAYFNLNHEARYKMHPARVDFGVFYEFTVPPKIEIFQEILNFLRSQETAQVFGPETEALEKKIVDTETRKAEINKRLQSIFLHMFETTQTDSPDETFDAINEFLEGKRIEQEAEESKVLKFEERKPRPNEIILDESDWDLYPWLLEKVYSLFRLPEGEFQTSYRNAVAFRDKAKEIPTIKKIRPGIRISSAENPDTTEKSYPITVKYFITVSGEATYKQLNEITQAPYE